LGVGAPGKEIWGSALDREGRGWTALDAVCSANVPSVGWIPTRLMWTYHGPIRDRED